MPGKRFLGAVLLTAVLVLTGQGCGSSGAEQAAAERVTLTIWRVFDEDDSFREIMNAYRTLHPNVSFEYRSLRFDEYEDELLRAFAAGTGPDVFSVHNTWMGEYEALITPLPETLTIPYTETRGTIKKETVTVLREEPSLSIRALRQNFVDVVAGDVIRPYQPNPKEAPEERIFGLPLSVDTLALFYNRDLLNAASIAQPPLTWTEFQEQVISLTSVGANNEIFQSGAALGTSENVERAVDVVSLLMIQNGTNMTDDRNRATFAEENDAGVLAGADAVRFYTDFANPIKAVYTWNDAQPTSFDAFVTGKTAFFFGYSYHTPLIRSRAEKLNFGITAAPQIDGGKVANFANYWVETVSKSTQNVDWAWDFVQFSAEAEQVQSYLAATEKPPALRSLIETQLEDENLAPFASQLLLAESWYKGNDASVAEQAFLDLIDDALAGVELEEAIAEAQNKVNQTL